MPKGGAGLKAKLNMKRVRWPEVGEEFLAAGSNDLISIDLADLQTVMGRSREGLWLRAEGSWQACAERIIPGLPEGLRCVALQLRCETLEEAERFLGRLSEAMDSDTALIYGISGDTEQEGFAADLLIPASRSIRGDSSIPLTSGSTLQSSAHTYRDLQVFDAGGTSICYRAVDEDGSKVLIKEVYPISLAGSLMRVDDALVPIAEEGELRRSASSTLILAVERSKREKELEKDLNNDKCEFFERYRDHFEANNTFYTVYYDYGQGTLAERACRLSLREAVVLTGRVLEHLEKLHRVGYLHLDISPENILLGTVVDDVPSLKFIDLGSLRHKSTIETAQSFPCKDGYSPFELTGAMSSMESRRLIGEHTDTFSVGAVLYHLLTGKRVSWSVCRQGGGEIIPPDAPGLRNSIGREVAFMNGVDLTADEVCGVSPRVLEALNAFLAKALTNNPHKRFATAAEMRTAIRDLLQVIDSHQVWFGRMEMPGDFMEADIEQERQTMLDRSGRLMGRLAREPVYEAEDIRAVLQKDKAAILDKCSLMRSKEAVADYIARYGKDYHEILFVDESREACELFNGQLSGSHAGVQPLDNDRRTLIIFYGREKPIDNGIVAMVDADENPVWSLEFVRRKGRSPCHVIRILPRKRNTLISGASRSSALLLFGLPLLLGVALIWGMATRSWLGNHWMAVLKPSLDPNGWGWLPMQMRSLLSSCALLGPGASCEAASILLQGDFAPHTLVLRMLYRWGLLAAPVGAGVLTFFLCLFWERAKGSYLSASAFTVLLSRILWYILHNLGVTARLAGDLWLSRSAMLWNGILLVLILVWPGLAREKSRQPERCGLRMTYGVAVQWLLRPPLAALLQIDLISRPCSLLYLLWSLLAAAAIDLALETVFLHLRARSGYRSARSRRFYKMLGLSDYELEELDELLDEEQEVL